MNVYNESKKEKQRAPIAELIPLGQSAAINPSEKQQKSKAKKRPISLISNKSDSNYIFKS